MRQYVITEEEMLSLIESLELNKLREGNLHRDPEQARPEWAIRDDMHRSFHYVVVRWAQKMGFDGYRK